MTERPGGGCMTQNYQNTRSETLIKGGGGQREKQDNITLHKKCIIMY